MKRSVVTAVLLTFAMFSGCSSSSTAPAPTLNGVWSGASGGVSFTLTLTQAGAAVTGAGSANNGSAPIATAANGTVTGANFSLTIALAGYPPVNYAGTFVDRTMTGTLNGSGFANATLVMVRSP